MVERLGADLRKEFPGLSGFSARNIWYLRQFFLCYQDNLKLQQMVAEIGWTHNLIILDKCKDDLEREFYLRMTRKYGWTKNVLALRIQDQTYEKTLLNQTNFKTTLPAAISAQANLAVRDEYTFDFLELGDAHSERELERAIIARIEQFLREMGAMFSFMGSQYRLEIDGEEYLIDLLLYHRVRLPEENPSIGMILCREKKRTIVEYALRESNKPIGVAAYRTVRRLPAELN